MQAREVDRGNPVSEILYHENTLKTGKRARREINRDKFII